MSKSVCPVCGEILEYNYIYDYCVCECGFVCVQGSVVQLNEDKVLVQVPVLYDKVNIIEAKSKVEELMPVYKDFDNGKDK